MEEDLALEASKKPPPPKYCRVCGDRAVGFNFNAISCESCKSFFRRNARRQEHMVRCPYESKCDITLETRRHCKRCRLSKCFEIGMRKDMLPPEDSMYSPAIDDITKRSRKRCAKQQECSEAETSPPQIAQFSTVNDCSSSTQRSCVIVREELNMLCTSEHASATSSIVQDVPQGIKDMTRVSEEIRRAIEFAKQLRYFSALSEDDQIALTKRCAWEIACLRALLNFNPHTNTFGPNEFGDYYSMTISQCPVATHLTLRFLATIDPDWCSDRKLILLLIACSLFTPPRVDLRDRTSVQAAHDLYKATLFNYLQLDSSASYAKVRYTYNLCMQKLDELILLNDAMANAVRAFEQRAEPDPLLVEIFRL